MEAAAEVRDTVLLDLSDPGRLLPWPRGLLSMGPPEGEKATPSRVARPLASKPRP